MKHDDYAAIGAIAGILVGCWVCSAMSAAIDSGWHWWTIPAIVTITMLFLAFIWLGTAIGIAAGDRALRSRWK